MRKHLLYFAAATVSMFSVSCKSTSCGPQSNTCCVKPEASINIDSVSKFQQVTYAIGQNVASDMKKNGIDSLDYDFFMLAFKDVFVNDTNRLSDKKTQEIVRHLTDSMREKKMAPQLVQYLPNKTEGAEFMKNLKSNDSVVFTPSGLAYKITRTGNGKKPVETDAVNAHYEGKLLNGNIFDSSYKRGQPTEFPLNRVIKGWTEGLQYVEEGGEIILYIPYNLGYGYRGSGQKIPPYSTLIFKVELVNIVDAHKGHNHGPGEHHH